MSKQIPTRLMLCIIQDNNKCYKKNHNKEGMRTIIFQRIQTNEIVTRKTDVALVGTADKQLVILQCFKKE